MTSGVYGSNSGLINSIWLTGRPITLIISQYNLISGTRFLDNFCYIKRTRVSLQICLEIAGVAATAAPGRDSLLTGEGAETFCTLFIGGTRPAPRSKVLSNSH